MRSRGEEERDRDREKAALLVGIESAIINFSVLHFSTLQKLSIVLAKQLPLQLWRAVLFF
jgi:hypothetical protein